MQAQQEKTEWWRGLQIHSILWCCGHSLNTEPRSTMYLILGSQCSLEGRQDEVEENNNHWSRQNRLQWLHHLLVEWPQISHLNLPKLHFLIFKMGTVVITYQGWGDACNEWANVMRSTFSSRHTVLSVLETKYVSNSQSKIGLWTFLIHGNLKLHGLTTNSQSRKYRVLLEDFKALNLPCNWEKNLSSCYFLPGEKNKAFLKPSEQDISLLKETGVFYRNFQVQHPCYIHCAENSSIYYEPKNHLHVLRNNLLNMR